MNVYDNILADQIEVGDQIMVNLDPIEVTEVGVDPDAPIEGIRVTGYSYDTGDSVTYDLHFSDEVSLWAVFNVDED